jgi:hypothetical protein
MKKMFLSMTIIVFLLLCSNGIQAQEATNDLNQLKLMQKYLVGTWQSVTSSDTTISFDCVQYGNAFEETDFIIVNGKKSIESFWSYSYKPERDNFYIFAAYVKGGYDTWIGSFTTENKYIQKYVDTFNPNKVLLTVEFVFNTPTSCTITEFNADGTKAFESKATKVK